MTVFVDTAAWLALLNTRDALHAPALRVMAGLQRQNALLTTTEFILIELANALSAPAFRVQAAAFIEGLQTLTYARIVPASAMLFADGMNLYRERPDKQWSLIDCTSFIVMREANITDAFSSDHHFEQAGFIKLL
ncbi:MAG: type II toxin-antitoxin system VapC family toxin [Pyrinomonadaceae bacterium]